MEQVEVDGPCLVVTVGPAASGKSTLLRQLLQDGVLDEVVSTDAIRAELDLPAAETARTYATARRRVRALLGAGRVVAVDATNVRTQDRLMWQSLATRVGARAIALRVGLGLDLDDLVERDAGRDRHVPVDAIAQQLRLATTSQPDVLEVEGFSVIDPTSVALVRRVPAAAST